MSCGTLETLFESQELSKPKGHHFQKKVQRPVAQIGKLNLLVDQQSSYFLE